MDAQILYFTRRLHSAEKNCECEWTYVAVPISREHLNSTPAVIPSTTPEMCREIDLELLSRMAILLDFEDGRMKGWKLHAIKGPTLGVAEKNAPIHYQAEVIVVREKPLHISDISSEGGESVKEESLISLEV